MTHDQALAALHRAGRRKLGLQTLVAVVGAVGFGASQIPGDIERGLDLSTAVGMAVLRALIWGLPLWLFFRYAFTEEQRRVLRVEDLVSAEVVEVHDRGILTVRTKEGTDLVLPTMKRVDRLRVGQRVWLTAPAQLEATVTAVAEAANGTRGAPCQLATRTGRGVDQMAVSQRQGVSPRSPPSGC